MDCSGCVNYKPKEFGDNVETSWVDPKTELEWQMEKYSDTLTWSEALKYANSLGNGWRLPTIEELGTLLDRSKYNPAARKEIPFKDSLFYWSSTDYADDTTNYVWSVNFHDGLVYYCYKSYDYHVRCVRKV